MYTASIDRAVFLYIEWCVVDAKCDGELSIVSVLSRLDDVEPHELKMASISCRCFCCSCLCASRASINCKQKQKPISVRLIPKLAISNAQRKQCVSTNLLQPARAPFPLQSVLEFSVLEDPVLLELIFEPQCRSWQVAHHYTPHWMACRHYECYPCRDLCMA